MKQNISVVKARTHKLKIKLTNSDGLPYELAQGEKLIFGVKKSFCDTNYAIVKTITNSSALGTGVYSFELTPADTESLFPDTMYFYDIGLDSGDSYYSVINASRFYLEGNVTKKGAQ